MSYVNTLLDLSRTLETRRRQGQRPPLVILAEEHAYAPLLDSVVDVVNTPSHAATPERVLSYRYLAHLLRESLLGTIVTLDASSELDKAVYEFVGVEGCLRLVVGEHAPAYIYQALLDFDIPRTKLVKCRGDVLGRSSSPDLPRGVVPQALTHIAQSSDVLWIGPLRDEMFSQLMPGLQRAKIWLAGENLTTLDMSAFTILDCSHDEHDSTIFRDVATRIATLESDSLREYTRKRVAEELSSGQHIDSGSSDGLVRRLAQEIGNSCGEWDASVLFVYIHDPAAPGGSEVEKRIVRYLDHGQGGPAQIRLTVKGKRLRWTDRRASSLDLDPQALAMIRKVYIVDSISFTGTTLRLATEAVLSVLPHAEIFWGILVETAQLTNNSDLPIPQDHIISAVKTRKHDIFFPWGWTQATANLVRAVPVHKGEHEVLINQRPWGTIEILADQMLCSVRILTIRAGERLSLQRHHLRDEFFVALDNYVGIEYESKDGKVIEASVLMKGDFLSIPRGAVHRFAAYRDSVRLLEVAFGLYDQRNDIERLADDYGRENMTGEV